MFKLGSIRKCLIYTIIAFALLTFILQIFGSQKYQHFAVQTQSFLQGKLDLPINSFPNNQDFVFVKGKYYWPQGPFPSVILMPFQALFGPNFNQWIMQLMLFGACLFLLNKLNLFYKFDKEDSLYLILIFFIGSPILNLITNPSSSQYAQIVAVSFLIALVTEFVYGKRPFIMGILSGAILATRPTAAVISLIIFYTIIRQKSFKKIFLFLIPILISVFLLGIFNNLRFGNFFDNGYMHTISPNVELDSLRLQGLFSPINIPTNFYYYFLTSFKPIISSDFRLVYPFITFDPWGLSFFIVAPVFIFTLINIRQHLYKTFRYWFVVLVTLVMILNYYHPGFAQFGPRNTADFLPVLYLILLISIKNHKLSSFQKNLIIFSCILNLYLLTRGFLIVST